MHGFTQSIHGIEPAREVVRGACQRRSGAVRAPRVAGGTCGGKGEGPVWAQASASRRGRRSDPARSVRGVARVRQCGSAGQAVSRHDSSAIGRRTTYGAVGKGQGAAVVRGHDECCYASRAVPATWTQRAPLPLPNPVITPFSTPPDIARGGQA